MVDGAVTDIRCVAVTTLGHWLTRTVPGGLRDRRHRPTAGACHGVAATVRARPAGRRGGPHALPAACRPGRSIVQRTDVRQGCTTSIRDGDNADTIAAQLVAMLGRRAYVGTCFLATLDCSPGEPAAVGRPTRVRHGSRPQRLRPMEGRGRAGGRSSLEPELDHPHLPHRLDRSGRPGGPPHPVERISRRDHDDGSPTRCASRPEPRISPGRSGASQRSTPAPACGISPAPRASVVTRSRNAWSQHSASTRCDQRRTDPARVRPCRMSLAPAGPSTIR